MPTSEARIRANQQNAQLSSGPRTIEGKAISRMNSLKHGLTGEGIVVSSEEAAEVENRSALLHSEMKPSTELARLLIHRVALHSVRMERSAQQEMAAVEAHVRQAVADFVAPEGVDEAEAAMLREEAGRVALFDPSKEACLARRYEAAAERGFFKALNEFRKVEKLAQMEIATTQADASEDLLGSFLQASQELQRSESLPPTSPRQAAPQTTQNPSISRSMPAPSGFDVPITIGRAR